MKYGQIMNMLRDHCEVSQLSNEELVEKLIAKVWSKLAMDSHEANLLEIAIERIKQLDELTGKKGEVMSYSLISECGTCALRDHCTDRHFIEGAISGIHQVWPAEKGHLGSGTIEIKCTKLIQPETTK